MPAEGLAPGPVDVTSKAGHPAQHLKRGNIEIWTFTSPGCNEVIDFVATGRSCRTLECHGVVSTTNQLVTRSSMHASYSAWVVLTELQYRSASWA